MLTRLGWSSPPPPEQWHGHKGHGQVNSKTTKRAMMTTTRVASNDKGDGDGNKGGGQAIAMRVMVVMMTVVGDNEGDGNSNEGGRQQRG